MPLSHPLPLYCGICKDSTKGYKIVDELIAAGYKEESTCVPFSRGEVIRAPELRARWESIVKY